MHAPCHLTKAVTLLGILVATTTPSLVSANLIYAVVVSDKKQPPCVARASDKRRPDKFPLSASSPPSKPCRPKGPDEVHVVPDSVFRKNKSRTNQYLLDIRGGSSSYNNNDRGGGSFRTSPRGEEAGYNYDYDDKRRSSRQGYNDYGDYGAESSSTRDDDGDYYESEQQRDRYSNDDRRYNSYEDEGMYRGDYGYDDRERDASSPSRSYSSVSSGFASNMPDIIRNGNKQFGFLLLAGGAFTTMMGMFLMFNKSLLRIGNFLFIAGVPMTIGPSRTMGYFMQPKKVRATATLACGIFLVLIGWPVLGIGMEIFGLLNLFGNMFPVLMMLLRQLPVVGTLFGGGGGNGNGNYSRQQRRRSSSRNDEDNYYGDDDGYYKDDDGGYYNDDGYYGNDRYGSRRGEEEDTERYY